MYANGRLTIGNPSSIEVTRTATETEKQFAEKARGKKTMFDEPRNHKELIKMLNEAHGEGNYNLSNAYLYFSESGIEITNNKSPQSVPVDEIEMIGYYHKLLYLHP